MSKNLKEILGFITDPIRTTKDDREFVNVQVLEQQTGLLDKLKEERQLDFEEALYEFLGDDVEELIPATRMCNKLEYYPVAGELVIEYASGKAYSYYSVPVSVWLDLLLSDQYGNISSYIRNNIRSNSNYFGDE